MALIYRTFRGKRVSREWDVLLSAAARAGVRFTLNSGARTMREQAALYRLYRSGKGNLAAVPSPNAPHIRLGRADHAIDVDALDGGVDRLRVWLGKQGVKTSLPVKGEPWHTECVSRTALKDAAARLSDPLVAAGFTRKTASRIRRYDDYKRRNVHRAARVVLRKLLKDALKRERKRTNKGQDDWSRITTLKARAE